MSQALARKSEAPALVEGEFTFTANDFAQIAALLYEQAGITLSDSKSTLVYSRLAKRLRALGLGTFAEYIAFVSSPAGDAERGSMLNALTTNVTRFFREPHHFDHLRDLLAPRIAAVKAGRARLRLWSAGSSTGQEAYSMAMTVLSLLPDAPNHDVKILATDIDTKVLATGRDAIYSEELISAIPPEARNRWLEKDRNSGDWRMGAAARALVSFKELNLIGQWPVKGPFDVIFCRNVVIYFDEPTQERIWSRFAPLLGTEGRLYIGHSERVAGANGNWVSDGLTVYRHQAGGAR